MELWVFGYGSLCWNPGFKFLDSVTGHIKGFTRKFWQGNTTHRGTPHKPGRVATLVEEENGVVWGRAFLVGEAGAVAYLERREVELGGYTARRTEFHPRGGGPPLQALLYLATPDNRLWLGHAPDHEIAAQIATTSGPSGHNVEYLLRLADFMREHLPGAEDDHLFKLEALVRSSGGEENDQPQQGPAEPGHFADRVHTNKLRCLRI